MKTFNKQMSAMLIALICAFVLMAGSAFAATYVTEPATVYANSASPSAEEIGVVKLQEIGENSLSDGYFTIKIPANVKLANLGGATGSAGDIARTTTVLGSAGTGAKALYVYSSAAWSAGGSGLIGFRTYSGNSFYTIMKVFSSGGTHKLVYGTATASGESNKVFVSDFATAGTQGVVQNANAGGSSTTQIGQIYFDDATNETVITLAGADSNPNAAEQLYLTGLKLKPATTNSTGDVNLSILNGKADGTAAVMGITDDTSVKVMTLVNQAANVTGTASTSTVPSIKAGAVAKQNIGTVKVTVVDAIASPDTTNNTLTFTLNNGAKFHSDAATSTAIKEDLDNDGTLSDIPTTSLTVNSSGQLIVALDTYSTINESGYVIINPSELIDASGITAAGDISCTVTGAGDFSNVNQTVKVAEAFVGGSTISFVDNTTAGFTTLYSGRDAQHLGSSEYILVGETAPASLFADGTIIMSLDQGAKFQTSAANAVDISAYTTSPYADGLVVSTDSDTASASSMTISVTTASSSANGKGAFKVGDQSTDWLDLTHATAGDLTMTFSGTAGVSGSVAFATIINATSTSTTPVTIVPGAQVTVPDITIQENHYGALVSGGYIGLKFPSTMTLDSSVTPTITTTPANGSASTTKVSYDSYDTTNNVVYFLVNDNSDSTSGKYTIVISGLVVTASNTAGSGASSFTIGGDDADTGFTSATFGSNYGAKPTSESVQFGNVVSSTVPFIGDASVSDGVVTQNFIPASGNIGQVGDMYIFTSDGQFYDGAVWGNVQATYKSGVVLDETTLTYPVSSLATGVKVYVGYGVGVTDTYASLNSNGTFGIGYTVPFVFAATPSSVSIAPEATAKVAIAHGTAPYTIVSSDETIATVNVATLAADGNIVITGVAAGTATVTITDSASNSVDVAVTVKAVPPTPVPSGQNSTEIKGAAIVKAPVNMGTIATGRGKQMQLALNFPKYAAAVDIYVGISLPDGTLLMLDSDGSLTPSLVPYATGVTAATKATVFKAFDVCTPFGTPAVPTGTWTAYSLVVPTNGGLFNTIDWATGDYDISYYSFDVNCSSK